jgi:hypothetical protein
MNTMMEEQVIDVQSETVEEEIRKVDLPVTVSEAQPVKTKEEREMEKERFEAIKKLIKQKRKYYKSNLFQIRKIDDNK